MSPLKKGQKLTDNPRNVNLAIRLTQGESQLLTECAEKLNTTKTKVILKGINLVAAEMQKK